MDGRIYDIFRQPLGFSNITPWILLIILFSTLQTLVLLHLGMRSVGVVKSVKNSWLPALIMSMIGYCSRRLLLTPYHVLIFTFMLFLSISIIGRTSVLSAIIATIFSQVVAACGTVIILEPMMLLVNETILEFSIKNSPLYCLGIIIEGFVPAIALVFFVRYKLSMFGRVRKDALRQ